MRGPLICIFACATVSCWAQSDLVGPGKFPETRSLSAMSGGGFGVGADGRATFAGAMAFSTPTAYGLGHGQWALGFGATSPNRQLRFVDLKKDGGQSNGTGYIMHGFQTRYGALTWSLMLPSTQLDELTSNVQFSLDRSFGGVRVAVGVQDMGDTTGTFDPYEPRSARSFYFVSTASPSPETHVSLGFGDQRFGGVFGNVSQNLSNDWKVLAEWDTYNWNYGVAYRLGTYRPGSVTGGRPVEATVFLGLVRGKYASWSLGFTF